MRTSREERLLATIDLLTNRLAHSHAELRRVCDELDWAHEKLRVFERVVVRLGKKD